MPDLPAKRPPWIETLVGQELSTLGTAASFSPRMCDPDGLLVRVGRKGSHTTIPYADLQSAYDRLLTDEALMLNDVPGKPQHRSYIIAMLAAALSVEVSRSPLRIAIDHTSILNRVKSLHPSVLEQILVRQKQLGEEAELVAMKSEQGRLQKAGLSELARQVKRVSEENCAAGYDIRSFDEDGSEVFIEVKGSRESKVTFDISANELAVASQLGPRYMSTWY